MDNAGREAIGVTPLSETAGADISDERFRVYTWPNGAKIRVEEPKTLYVKPPTPGSLGGGSHRIVKKDGTAVYISYGWLSIEWTVHIGKPVIAF